MLFSEAMSHVKAIMFNIRSGRNFQYLVGNDIIAFDGHEVTVNDLVLAKQFIGKNNAHWLLYDSQFDDNCQFISDFALMLKVYISKHIQDYGECMEYTAFNISEFTFDYTTEVFDRP